tara:strand:- start:176 stop:514 length:339 start_codon:yes stop_codon:yes gene_type:complete
MSDAGILKNLEISGWTAVFLIVCYGIYKLVLARGLASKCGWFELDLRSKEVRLKELEDKKELDLKKLKIQELKLKAEILKYEAVVNKQYDGNYAENTSESSEDETDTRKTMG